MANDPVAHSAENDATCGARWSFASASLLTSVKVEVTCGEPVAHEGQHVGFFGRSLDGTPAALVWDRVNSARKD